VHLNGADAEDAGPSDAAHREDRFLFGTGEVEIQGWAKGKEIQQ
jgi:hypothetical protein